MSRIISMLAKLSFLGATAAVIAFAPAPAAAASPAPLDICWHPPDITCPPDTPEDCSAACLAHYPNDGGVSRCTSDICRCAC